MTEIRTKPLGTQGAPEPVSEANPLAVAVSESGGIIPSVTTATAAVLTQTACKIYWVTASNGHGTEITEVELNDSTDDGGIDRWGVYLGDNVAGTSAIHAIFDPPIQMNNGIYVDLTNATTVRVTVGFKND